jgi:hypothetical protein
MADAFTGDYDMAGYRFRLCATPRFLGSHVASYLEPFRSTAAHSDPVPTYSIDLDPAHRAKVSRVSAPYYVTIDGEEERSSCYAGRMIEHLLWTINHRAIDQIASHVAVHAAGVTRDGAGIVLPAPMGGGKTTLAAGLVHSGLSYLTDEMVLIEPASGWMVPFPRALWADRKSVALIPGLGERVEGQFMAPDAESVHVRPDDLRTGAIGEPCPVRFVLMPSYEAGVRTTVEPVSRGRTLQYLAVHSPNIQRFGARGLAVLADVVAAASCFRLRLGDLWSGVDAAWDLLRRAPSPASSWSPVPTEGPDRTQAGAAQATAGARPNRRCDVAGVEIDGETVLYDVSSGRVHLLNTIAGVLWANFDGDLSVDELAAELARASGHGTAEVRNSVIELVRRLESEGLLESSPHRAAG